MFEPRTMRALAAMRPLRVICECEVERVIEVAEKHLDMKVEVYARALRCSVCRRKGGKTFIGTISQQRKSTPKLVSLWDRQGAHRPPQKRLDFIGLAFAIADKENREAFEAIHGKPFELAEQERRQLLEIRAMLGWAND